MGLEKTQEFLINHKELKAFLIFTTKNGEMQTFKSENFED